MSFMCRSAVLVSSNSTVSFLSVKVQSANISKKMEKLEVKPRKSRLLGFGEKETEGRYT